MKPRAEGLKATLSEGFSYYKENQNAGLISALRFNIFLPAEYGACRNEARGKPLPAVGKAPIDQRG
jgi:hypothetical protein